MMLFFLIGDTNFSFIVLSLKIPGIVYIVDGGNCTVLCFADTLIIVHNTDKHTDQ